jgi:hypothetical protein
MYSRLRARARRAFISRDGAGDYNTRVRCWYTSTDHVPGRLVPPTDVPRQSFDGDLRQGLAEVQVRALAGSVCGVCWFAWLPAVMRGGARVRMNIYIYVCVCVCVCVCVLEREPAERDERGAGRALRAAALGEPAAVRRLRRPGKEAD